MNPLNLSRDAWATRLYVLLIIGLVAGAFALAALAEEALWIASPSFLVGMFFWAFTIFVKTGRWH